jgi:branched-subunit amino acid transport protein AzlD
MVTVLYLTKILPHSCPNIPKRNRMTQKSNPAVSAAMFARIHVCAFLKVRCMACHLQINEVSAANLSILSIQSER